MEIKDYKTLISSLPVLEQCFTTKRTTWQKAEVEHPWLKSMNDKFFADQETLLISRKDIFDTEILRERIIKTIYWGYTAGMRGSNFTNILKKIEVIEAILKEVIDMPNLSHEDFEILKNKFSDIKGIALSTYSKLLYFNKISFNQNPCMILDQRIINVLSSEKYKDIEGFAKIKYENAERFYQSYIQRINELSNSLKTSQENIELFLFTFGSNLKQNEN